MAVATDDVSDDAAQKYSSKTVSASLLKSDKKSDFLPTLDAQRHAASNLYEPEPTALTKVCEVYQIQ